MTDDTERVFRTSLAELVRDKPPLGRVDVAAVVRGAGTPQPGRGSAIRWLGAAAVIVVLAGVGFAAWFNPGVPAEPATGGSLVGTRWLATQIKGSPAIADSAGHLPHLAFGSGSELTGGDPCNGMQGRYSLRGEQLSFSGLVVTEMACQDVRQQSAYQLALNTVAGFERQTSTLTLFDANGRPVLVFRAAAGPTDTVQIRVRNDSKVGFDRVRVTFPAGNVADYGAVAAGASSEYVRAGDAYSYAPVKVTVDGTEHAIQPIDYVGETELGTGYYTYALDLEDGNLALSFESDQ